ncbi:hypothetical protein ACU635_50910 [[Actinomadura] parvosata]|uniref:hypothetical protein n=1 Tax=[Actinomadura] parvosata TaxID=1955412 RepID=UPI00406D1D25
MTETKSFLGIPVVGDINEGGKRPKQRPIEDLAPLMQAVLDDPTIVEFGWTQYTPYFNDGDPCVFGVRGEIWVRTVTDQDVDDKYELEVSRYGGHPSLGERGRTWSGSTYVEKPYEGPDEARYDRCLALNDAIEGGEFLDVLLDAFGDHAEITVRKDGIQVEFYQHD